METAELTTRIVCMKNSFEPESVRSRSELFPRVRANASGHSNSSARCVTLVSRSARRSGPTARVDKGHTVSSIFFFSAFMTFHILLLVLASV